MGHIVAMVTAGPSWLGACTLSSEGVRSPLRVWFPRMDLPGQLSNPSVKASWERLASALASLRASNAAPRRSGARRGTRRRGEVRGVIARLLRDAEEPLFAREIHRAVERELGEAVSWSSIANCLRRNSADEFGGFERVGMGLYRRRDNRH